MVIRKNQNIVTFFSKKYDNLEKSYQRVIGTIKVMSNDDTEK